MWCPLRLLWFCLAFLWWLMMLSIFSHACWPLVREMSIQIFCSHFMGLYVSFDCWDFLNPYLRTHPLNWERGEWRKRKKEGESIDEREKHLPVAYYMHPDQGLNPHPRMYPKQESNLRPLGPLDAPTNWATLARASLLSFNCSFSLFYYFQLYWAIIDWYNSSLCILNIRPLSHVWFTNVSPIQWVVFSLSNSVFWSKSFSF